MIDKAAIEAECASLLAQYLRKEIGELMHQAEHWAANGKPGAVHHRVMKADNYYQVVSLMERDPKKGWGLPFDEIREALSRPPVNPPGVYPPSPDLHSYRDPLFVAAKLEAAHSDAAADLQEGRPMDDQLREALRAHHEWHLGHSDADEHGIIPAEAYCESKLCDQTLAALSEQEAGRPARTRPAPPQPSRLPATDASTGRAASDEVRHLVAKLYCASGCSCCRNDEEWQAASDALAEIFGVPRYDDDSGYDWLSTRDAAQKGKRP